MTIEDRRKELRAWLDDMSELKSWVDLGNAEAEPFANAFEAAREKALAAASAYAEAVKREAHR